MLKASSSVAAFVALCLLAGSSAQIYRVCARPGLAQECQAVERDGSTVACVNVIDHTDCALKISQGQADFGVFTAEEVVLISQLQSDVYNVLASVKHDQRKNDDFAFQSVAVVRGSHTGGLSGLRGGHFCHPGFGSREQLWSNRVLKFFEQQVVYSSRQCVASSKTPAESDGHALTQFFGSACRPGPWVADGALDAQLKSKFPVLCALCGTSDGSCVYESPTMPKVAGTSSHHMALDCLTKQGTVAYVAWQHARDFFTARTDTTDFGLLCQNGTVVPLDNLTLLSSNAPCAWIKQPWSAVLASKRVSTELSAGLKSWFPTGRSKNSSVNWISFLDSILFKEPSDVLDFPAQDLATVTDYVLQGRPIPSESEPSCHGQQRWCTTSAAESLKCAWVQKALLTIGAEPLVTCVPAESSVNCLKFIKENRADFFSVDSNYGYLARRAYDLVNVLYHETRNAYRSKVIALLKNNSTANITRFENLRDKNACFPEYGGIAWVSFLRAAHERAVISAKECDSAVAIGDFFAGTCAPGATDEKHSPSKNANVTTLCSVCRSAEVAVPGVTTSINELGVSVLSPATQSSAEKVCSADHRNLYFGTNGTLACIAAPHSDVAFIENQYLADHAIKLGLNPSDFRVLCRNNSLAAYTGFNVDTACLLSETVDSEIVTRRGNPDLLSISALMRELDEHFGYIAASNILIGLEVFSPFNNMQDLLFKDTTIGLTNSDSRSESVQNYVDLFKHTDECYGSSATTPATTGSTATKFTLLSATIITYVLAVYIV